MSKQKGFTLIEIIIAMTIFAIISVVVSTILFVIVQAQDKIQVSSERLNQLQVTMSLIERDITQITPRLYKDPKSALQVPIQGTNQAMQFTTSGNINPDSLQNRSNLQRVRYEFKNNRLTRISQPNINMSKAEQEHTRMLIDKVKSIKLLYLSHNNQWVDRWVVTMPAIYSTSALRVLPKAIKVSLELQDWGNVEILCALSQHTTTLSQNA